MQPTIAQIKQAVVQHFGMTMNELVCARRARRIARPRQIAMYLCKELTPASCPQIGLHFDRRDHTTIMHAVSVITRLRAENAYFGDRDCRIGDAIEQIIRQLTDDPRQLKLSLVA